MVDMATAVMIVGACFSLGFAVFGGSLAQGYTAGKALEGIARNPEAKDKMQVPLIIGLAFIESSLIYVLVLAIVIIFTKT